VKTTNKRRFRKAGLTKKAIAPLLGGILFACGGRAESPPP